jgi:toxin ParE1/3/4
MELFVRPKFYEDAAQEVESLATRAGPEIAERWHAALDETMQQLVRHPFLGRKRKDLHLPEVRSWRVNNFPHWLIFYTIEESSIVMLRVRYGMIDLENMEVA